MSLKAMGTGLQVLKIIYQPPRGGDGWLKLSGFLLKDIPESFTNCEDAKACLAELGKSPAGMEIRNSNWLQWQCLAFQPRNTSSACKEWRKCLGSSGLEHFKSLLQAVHADRAPRFSTRTSVETCVDDNAGLQADSGRNVLSCAAAARFCADETYGPMVQKNCPKKCGSCTATPFGVESTDLSDIDVGINTNLAVQGWTLTPTPPAWTQTPTEDQACFPDPESVCIWHVFRSRKHQCLLFACRF